MYTVYLATRGGPESSVAASSLAHAKSIVNDFLQTNGRGARVRIEADGQPFPVVYEFPVPALPVHPSLQRELAAGAVKSQEQLARQLAASRVPWKHEAPWTVLEMPAHGPPREIPVWESVVKARKILDAFCSRNRRAGAAAALYGRGKKLLESRDCEGGVWVVTSPQAGRRRKHR